MLTNSKATLYNKYTEKATKTTKYAKTIIDSVAWQGQPLVATISSTESGKGIVNITSSINVFIPFLSDFEGKSYISPKAWLFLADADRDKYFTFQELDFIAKGECDFNSVTKPIADLTKTKDNVVIIMSTMVNDYGSEGMKHYMLGCK